MSYFSKFPLIAYDIKGDKNRNYKLLPDILRRVKLQRSVIKSVVVCIFDAV